MSKGEHGGLLGGDEEAEHEQKEGNTDISIAITAGATAIAASLAINQSKYGSDVAVAAKSFLEKQGSLVDEQRNVLKSQEHHLKTQTHHLEDEHKLRLSLLSGQRVAQRVRISLQFFMIFVASLFGLGIVTMVYGAVTSRSVMVDKFKAPASLAERGLTGEVLATNILDVLQKMQSSTRSLTEGLKTTNAWLSEIKIDVPEIGMSIGEIERLLHDRFSHDVHISGDLIQTLSGGLALTVRGEGVPAKTFEGELRELDMLTTQASEYIYGRSQPERYATYLQNHQRDKDALDFLPGAYLRSENNEERAALATLSGNSFLLLAQYKQAAEKYRLAMSLKPNNWRAWGDLIGILPFLEGEEAAWRESDAFLRAANQAKESDRPTPSEETNPVQTTWDLPLLLDITRKQAKFNNGNGAVTTILGPSLADIYALMHDTDQIIPAMAGSDPEDSTTKAEALLLLAYAALEHNDAAAAVPSMEAFWVMWKADPSLQFTYADNQCLAGLALGMAGRLPEAEMRFKESGQWSRCDAYHGDVLEHAGKLKEAEQVWNEGLKIAPSLPYIYLHRGLSEMKRGVVDKAAADFTKANAQAPHWADPLKVWGDLLVSQGNWKEAVLKYDEALKYAPAWVELKQAWSEAKKHVS